MTGCIRDKPCIVQKPSICLYAKYKAISYMGLYVGPYPGVGSGLNFCQSQANCTPTSSQSLQNMPG